jgi:hypothetical protein
MSAAERPSAHRHAQTIHAAQREITRQTLRMAVHVRLARRLIPPADFAAWLDGLAFDQATAATLDRLADRFATIEDIERYQPGALFALSAIDVPPAALTEALSHTAGGQLLTCRAARAIIARHRQRAAAAQRPATIDAQPEAPSPPVVAPVAPPGPPPRIPRPPRPPREFPPPVPRSTHEPEQPQTPAGG